MTILSALFSFTLAPFFFSYLFFSFRPPVDSIHRPVLMCHNFFSSVLQYYPACCWNIYIILFCYVRLLFHSFIYTNKQINIEYIPAHTNRIFSQLLCFRYHYDYYYDYSYDYYYCYHCCYTYLGCSPVSSRTNSIAK